MITEIITYDLKDGLFDKRGKKYSYSISFGSSLFIFNSPQHLIFLYPVYFTHIKTISGLSEIFLFILLKV